MPNVFVFEKESVRAKEIPQTDWKLAFELKKPKQPHTLDLEESWEKSLARQGKINWSSSLKVSPHRNQVK